MLTVTDSTTKDPIPFPRKGDLFAVTATHIADIGGWHTCFLRCIQSDQHRVLAEVVYPGDASHVRPLFHRDHWRFDDASAFVEVLSLDKQKSEPTETADPAVQNLTTHWIKP